MREPGEESLRCPQCDQALAVERHHGADIHVCPGCRGMFLAHGELNKVAEATSGDLEFSTVDLDSFRHDDAQESLQCPHCRSALMDKVEFNIYTSIILDYCRRCRGFWLDGAELDCINAEVRGLNEAAAKVPDPPMLWLTRFAAGLPR